MNFNLRLLSATRSEGGGLELDQRFWQRGSRLGPQHCYNLFYLYCIALPLYLCVFFNFLLPKSCQRSCVFPHFFLLPLRRLCLKVVAGRVSRCCDLAALKPSSIVLIHLSILDKLPRRICIKSLEETLSMSRWSQQIFPS